MKTSRLLCDAEIIEKVERLGMIDPFCRHQVREINNEKVVSYGLSSSGYDIRIGSKFRFPMSLSLDPLNQVEGEWDIVETPEPFLLPGGHFLLGLSVEYFRMPENVMAIALGKSTYARCLSGNTEIALANGTSISFIDLVKRTSLGERLWGYGVDESNRVVITELTNARLIGKEKLVEVKLDNNCSIKCTSDHKFLLRDGIYKEASQLTAGASLFPIYRKYRLYEAVLQPNEEYMISTYVLADDWNIRHGIYLNNSNMHRHHIDENKSNNFPTNIIRRQASEHIKYHNDKMWSEPGRKKRYSIMQKERIVLLGPKYLEKMKENFRNGALAFWHDPKYAKQRKERILSITTWSVEKRKRSSDTHKRMFSNPDYVLKVEKFLHQWKYATEEHHKQQADVMRRIRTRLDITEETVTNALLQAKTMRGAARLLKGDRTTFRRFPLIIQQFKDGTLQQQNNHKVMSVRELNDVHDIYCLTTETGNFALESGVFIHNCGVFPNITPLEAGWKGHLTIEIANLGHVPVKIYPNQGIAQLVFFELDCRPLVTYADRQGKYMNQQDILLARG